jgi:FixJ family two-component response regulator
VTTFADGDSFLSAAKTRVPICVFLDVVLPERSGLEILQELRTQQYLAPIVLVSALDDLATAVEGMKHGAVDYIRKPFDRYAPAARARDAVEFWLRRERQGDVFDPRPNESCEWFRLTPSEKEMLLMLRLMQA